ncbi:MAG: hypothetical protein ACHP84_04095 [Caulobacterales bacterium]
MRSPLLFALICGALAYGWAAAACAQVDLISRDTVHGVLDLRVAAADGEPSFTEGGFGKARFGGDGGSAFDSSVQISQAALEWTPRLTWDVSAVVDLLAQPGQEHFVDWGQAYLVYKPVPSSGTRFTARAGYFYPPVSLENDARVWGVTDTITPSAIDSWIGEEVKVVGVEGTVSHAFGDQQLGLTAGVFGFDDTAGTLLALRGWALHDVQSQANGRFPLPPLSPFMQRWQAGETYSTLEIDHRLGYYARLQWRPVAALTLDAFYYDNNGDRTGRTADLQWAWATNFAALGARWDLDERTHILAQALSGNTQFGRSRDGDLLSDMDFRAAYLLASRQVGRSAFTARADLFANHDNAEAQYGNTNEHGWALTGAWRYPLTTLLDVRLEAMRVQSTRPSRAFAGEAPLQAQTVLQSSLRLTF